MSAVENQTQVEYEIASKDAVAELHQRFLKRITDTADDVVKIAFGEKRGENGSQLEGAVHAAAVEIFLHAARMRISDYTAANIAHALKGVVNDNYARILVAQYKYAITGLAELREKEASISYGAAEVPGATMEAFRKAAEYRPHDARLEKAFNGEERIYLHIKCDASPLQAAVEQALILMPPAQRFGPWGYKIVDWSSGKATDRTGKQVFKIGKLLQEHAPHLLEGFQRRATGKHMIVISRNVDDIARASTNRAWQSCAGAGAEHRYAFGKMETGIKAGVMIAYLVSVNDPDIHTPLARMMINPFVRDIKRDRKDLGLGKSVSRRFAQWFGKIEKDTGGCIWFPGKIYGLKNELFEATVTRFIDEHLNTGSAGRFWLADGVYEDDRKVTERRRGVTEQRAARWDS